MKKRKIIIFIRADVLLASGAVACVFSVPRNKKDDPGVLKNKDNGTGRVVSPLGSDKEMTLQYNGTPVVLGYEFTCESPCVLGMMIYVNGLLQPYTAAGEKTIMHTEQMGEKDTKRFTCEFTPVCGKAGQELIIEFANIYNAQVMELKDGANTFGNSHTISQSMPWKLKLNADSPEIKYDISDVYEKKPFAKEDRVYFTQTDMYGVQTYRLDHVCEAAIYRDGKRLEENSVFQEKEQEELSIQMCGNLTGKYRVSLYGDFERIPLNGHDYVEVTVEKDSYAVIPFSLDLKEVKAKNLFVIAAPMDKENFVVKSSTIYIGRE